MLIDGFDEEADGAEAIVAAYHGGMGVLHPAVEEVAAAGSELCYKWLQRFPGLGTEGRGHGAVDGNPLAALGDVARVQDGVLVLGDEVGVGDFADGCDADLFHEYYNANKEE